MENQSIDLSRTHAAYPQDKISAKHPTYAYEGKITQSSTKVQAGKTDTSIRMVDGAVKVKSVDDKTRETTLKCLCHIKNRASEKKEHASEQKQKNKWHLYTGLAGIAVGCGIAISPLLLNAPFSAAATICGISLAALGLIESIASQRTINRIQKEIDNADSDIKAAENETVQWQDPVDKVIEQRRRAGTEGFQYAYRHQLKDKIVHPEEVQELWKRDFSKLLRHHQDAEQVFSDDLLGQKQILYAWNDRPIPALKLSGREISSSLLKLMEARYSECRQTYQQFCLTVNEQFESLRREKEQISGTISKLRSEWILPAYQMRSAGLEEALYLYNQAIDPYIQEKNRAIEHIEKAYHYTIRHPGNLEEAAYKNQLDALKNEAIKSVQCKFRTHPAVREIEEAYDQDRRMCNFLYDQAKLVVDSYFDKRIRNLENAVAIAESSINLQRSNGIQQFNFMLDRIFCADKEKTLQSFYSTMPSVSRNWTLPNLIKDPSWNEIYSRLPQFQSNFSNYLPQNSWNLFWGKHGINRYAAHPKNSWGSVCSNRSAFPFKQQWFHLHSIPCRQDTNCFMPSFAVPPVPYFSQQKTNSHRLGRTLHTDKTSTQQTSNSHRLGRTLHTE